MHANIHIKPSQLTEVLRFTLPDGPVMVWGSPGVGKSQIIQDSVRAIFDAVADARELDIFDKADNNYLGLTPVLFERRINDYDLLDFAGLPHIVDNVQKRALPDIWPGVGSDEPVYGVLFLDEFPQGAREKQTAVQRLLDEGRIGDYVLPGHPKSDPDCKRGLVAVVLAGNRQSDRANSHGMGTQTGSRMAHFTLAPDVDDWLSWAAKAHIDPLVTAFIRQMPEYLYKLDPAAKSDTPTGSTPRTLEKLSKAAQRCPPSPLEMPIYGGIVGEECARAFLALCHASRGINVEEALTSPDTCLIPPQPGHQFAAASLLIRRSNTTNFDNIVKFVQRPGWSSPEIGVFVVEAIKRRIPLVAETATYRDFCLRWADIRS